MVDRLECLTFIIDRCGAFVCSESYSRKTIIVLGVVSFENKSRQSAQLPGTIVNRDDFRVPCNPCSTLKLGNSLVALVTADGIDTVCELPVYRFHRFNAQISVSSKEIEIGSLALFWIVLIYFPINLSAITGEIDWYSICNICGDGRVSLEYRITVECGILVANLQEHFLFDAANEVSVLVYFFS